MEEPKDLLERILFISTDENNDEPIVYINRFKRVSTVVTFTSDEFAKLCEVNNLRPADGLRYALLEKGDYVGFYIGTSADDNAFSYVDYNTSMTIYYALNHVVKCDSLSKFKIIVIEELYDSDIINKVKKELDKESNNNFLNNMIICHRALNPQVLISDKDYLSGRMRACETIIDVNTDKVYKELIKLDEKFKNNGAKINFL